jgi:thiol:disulfide interchange protein DsbD
MKKIILLLFVLSIFISLSFSEILKPVKWTYRLEYKGNDKAEIIFTSNIDKGWHLYSINLPEGGPIATNFVFDTIRNAKLIDRVVVISKAEEKWDESFQMKLKMFSNKAQFKQIIAIEPDKPVYISGYIEYMCCDNSRCLPPTEEPFEITFIHEKDNVEKKYKSDEIVAINDSVNVTEDEVEKKTDTINVSEIKSDNQSSEGIFKKGSLWSFFIISFFAGLAGILTPCVFPMIPMTVGFFINKSKSKLRSFLNAIIFGISITAIFTSIGIIITLTSAGADFANVLSSHWIPNIIFFLLFILFSFSLFGYYEIVIPSWLINKTDAKSEKGGIIGIFFMALTTVIVSLSCTGPIVGSLLVESVSGDVLKPTIGMFGFGFAFSLPFTLLAIFPGFIYKFPKSGSWMNAVKVFIGIIMIAFSFKFIVIVDQAYHLNLMNRELVLSIWIILFVFLGIYLWGKIQLPHDTEIVKLSFLRLIFGFASFVFAIYLFTGFLNNPLKTISVFLPSKTLINTKNELSDNKEFQCGRPKYYEIFKMPYGLQGFFDYDEGMNCARKQKQPVLLYFKGHACTNCKKMEEKVWSNQEVISILKENYIIITLYVDDKTTLPETEWEKSTISGKLLNTIGKKNADFQIKNYNINSQPYYVLLNNKGEMLTEPIGYEPNIDKYLNFLERGIKEFKKNY